jgi:hypothetical protein
VYRDQLSCSGSTAMIVHERRMNTLRKMRESSCTRKRQKVAGWEVLKRPALKIGRLAQTGKDWSTVCSGRHDRLYGCVLDMQPAKKHAQGKNGY